MPTAANLNLYRGGDSCVGWHRDDELLFGESGEAKLIVSVSLGGSAVFKWKRRFCPDDEGHLCCLGHGDILVMDGRCQDKFLHRTDPCREQERINVTFRWIKQHVASCPLFRTGVACCLPTCAQGLSIPVVGNFEYGIFWVFWLLFCVLCVGGFFALLVSLLHTGLGFLLCASCWTRPCGVVQWGHYLWNHGRECQAAHKISFYSRVRDVFSRGLVLGRGRASFRTVKLGGHKVRKDRGYAADAHDAADVFLYRDSSIASLLDLRRRLKAVMELVDAMIRYGVSLSRSVELSVQWDRILGIGPLFPVTSADFEGLLGVGLAVFSHGVCCIHRRLCDFIHSVVVHRRDEAIRGWRNWIREDPLVHPYKWLRPDLVPPSPFLLCEPHLSSGALGFYLILQGLMRNSERPGFPTFVVLGKGKPALRNSILRLRGGYHCCLRFLCLV